MARFDIPDHPEVRWALRTGYPSWMREADVDEADEDAAYEERREREVTTRSTRHPATAAPNASTPAAAPNGVSATCTARSRSTPTPDG